MKSLSMEALRGIVESFVLREGTDYGHRDYSLEQKCAAVKRQLEAGQAQIWFDLETSSTEIRPVEADDRDNVSRQPRQDVSRQPRQDVSRQPRQDVSRQPRQGCRASHDRTRTRGDV